MQGASPVSPCLLSPEMSPALLPTLALLLLTAAGHAQTRPALLPTAPLPTGTPPAPAVPQLSAPSADALDCRALSGRVADAAGHPLVGATARLRH
ncbi:hypothetical protein, partial [Hymenobacter sp. B1770]|uniref:hypothetical protein n=1 Tax=Hymenobacter sp. B1770 TaxID=1718788 RepID=UPI003CF63AC1